MKRFNILTIILVVIIGLSVASPAFADPGHGKHSHGNSSVDTSSTSTNSTVVDNDFPVHSAAPIFSNACSSGMSAQTAGVGGAVATTNIICDHIAMAGAYVAIGDLTAASAILSRAENEIRWRSIFAKIRGVLTLGIL